jgi:predicted RNA-binding Zn ribbon-like protein
MIRFTSEDDPAALAVGLANSWDVLGPDPEHLRDADSVRSLLRFYGREELAERVRERDVAALRRLRGRLRAAFEANDEGAAVQILNATLRPAGSAPQLRRDGSGWAFAYHDARASLVDVVATTTAMALLDAIRTTGWSRLGVCAAAPCRCVYVDRSRSGNRRFCCQLCADRAHQAARRRRLRGR